MPDFLYLDIDSPTLAQYTTYDGYSSGGGSATKSGFAELSPQRWPPEFSPAHFSFDFDLEDGENPFVYDAEASTKGMALPPPPPISPAAARNIKQIKSPLLSPGLRRGPLSYYGSIFEHVHFTEIQSPSPTNIHFSMHPNDNKSNFENPEDILKTEPREQVSPLTPSIECFGLSATSDRPVSELPMDHPPTPAIERFQIADSYSNVQNSNCSPVPSLSDSLTGSPRSQENTLDMTQALEPPALSINQKKRADPAAVLYSPFTPWPLKSAFSLSSDSDGDGDGSEDDSSEYSPHNLSEYLRSLSSDDEDNASYYGDGTRPLESEIDFHGELDDRKYSKTYEDDTRPLESEIDFHDELDDRKYLKTYEDDTRPLESEIDFHDELDDRKYSKTYEDDTRPMESEVGLHDELDDRKNSKIYDDTPFCGEPGAEINNAAHRSLENSVVNGSNGHDPGELVNSIARESIISYADSNSDSEMFDQLGIVLPLPPPSVQAPAWAGPPVDLKTLIREHLEATGQLKPERKRPTLQPVINNQIHFMPLKGPQSPKSDPGGEGSVGLPQWIPSPETPTFGVRIQNKMKAMLKPEKKKRPTPDSRNSIRTQKLLDEEFKPASLYTRRKKVDRTKIGAPVGPTIIVPDSNMQELVSIAEGLKKLAAEDAGKTCTSNPKLDNSSTVSLPMFNGIKRVDTFESTDDDNSSVEDAFVVHTPLRPRSVLPERDRRRRSHSLPGTFTFTESGVFAENRRFTKWTQSMKETEEGGYGNGDTEIEERVDTNATGMGDQDTAMMQISASLESFPESGGFLEVKGFIEVKGEPNVDANAGFDVEEPEIDDPSIERYQEAEPENISETSSSYRFMDNTPLTSSAASTISYDDFHEGGDHTVVYEDVMFELIPQRTVSGNSIWLGSDTVSASESISLGGGGMPYTEAESQQVSPLSTIASPVFIESSSHRCSTPPGSLPSSLPQPISVDEYRSQILDYNSPVQARLVIDPATEILIPFLLEEACGINPPCSCPRIIYEKTPELSRSPDISAHDVVSIPEPLLPLHRLKSSASQKNTTICSPGAGRSNGTHVPLRKKSISKPVILEERGSLASLNQGNKDVDLMFMIPTRQPPLPLRRSQSQLSLRQPPPHQPLRRPSDSDIPSSVHLEHGHTPPKISVPPPINNNEILSNKRNNPEKDTAGFPPPKIPIPPIPSSEGLPKEERKEKELSGQSISGKRRLAPPIPKLTLPTSPRPVKGSRPLLSPISIPPDDHDRDRAGKEKYTMYPLTPSTGKLIYSAPHSPPPSPSRQQTPAISHINSIRLQAQSYIYIPYTIPRIGGGVISREHRMKLATGRAAKRARKCKECGIQGGGEKEIEMWFCLECGCGWELCGECIKGSETALLTTY